MVKTTHQSKTENSFRNLSVSLIAYFITTVFSFVSRTIFVHVLSAQYLGLNGLFSNILSMLSLSELGVGSAMTYALYAPLRDGNIPLIQSIMRLYKKLYWIIGSVVLILGFSLTPFLSWFIKDMPSQVTEISLYYMLYVFHSGVSYFWTYKRTLIICDQREYVVTSLTTVLSLLTTLIQIAVLLLSGHYLYYLMVGIAMALGENVMISKTADRFYPYLKEKTVSPLSKDAMHQIQKNIYAMLCHKIGTLVVNSTDNLIISRFVGLTAVGLYSNYTLLLTKIAHLLRMFFSSVIASVGMLSLEEDKQHVECVFYRILFLNFWLYASCSIAFFCLIQPFINLWLGKDYLLSTITALTIAGNFYLTGLRQTVLTFRDAAGVFWHDRYKALIEALVNVLLSIPLARLYGVCGVLLGTIGSTLLVSFWYDGYILFRYLFHQKVYSYLRRQAFYLLLVLGVGALTFLLCQQVADKGVGTFLLKGCISLLVPNGVFCLCFYRTSEMVYYQKTIKILWNTHRRFWWKKQKK